MRLRVSKTTKNKPVITILVWETRVLAIKNKDVTMKEVIPGYLEQIRAFITYFAGNTHQ